MIVQPGMMTPGTTGTTGTGTGVIAGGAAAPTIATALAWTSTLTSTPAWAIATWAETLEIVAARAAIRVKVRILKGEIVLNE